MSGARFDRVIGVIDGILIWIIKSNKTECEMDPSHSFVEEKTNLA
jgi:hypothetical protein